ncbi:hypothetical protein CFOL_v3_22442, partial [Cephalotus follicularis]
LSARNDPISSSKHHSKKRRKNVETAPGERSDDYVPNKYAKMDLKGAAMSAPLIERSSSHSQTLTTNRVPNRDAFVFLNSKDSDKMRTGTIHYYRDSGDSVKAATELFGATHQKYEGKNASKQLEPQAKRSIKDANELEFSNEVRQKEKTGSSGLPDLNIPVDPVPVQSEKTASMPTKDISGLRPKGTMLERAIRELEKVVAESRPPNMEVQDADTSSLSVKRRLPSEVKLKLAKVARLAQSSHGKISEELINRLMSILGHLVQLRTLKRNLREMVLLGLSAKRDKADRFQHIKKEVVEMIKLQVFLISGGKGVLKDSRVIDKAMEDKICDLYDLYVQGMDEDKGPQIRKLYVELAELWPNGAMDNHGIRDVICRAKERRKASYDHVKVWTFAQPQIGQERLIPQSNIQNSASSDKMISSMETANQHLAASAKTSTSLFIDSNTELPKQAKLERMTFPMLKEQMK